MTDTLVAAGIGRAAFDAGAAGAVAGLAATYGELRRVVPLRSFGRVIVAFAKPADAARARRELPARVAALPGLAQAKVFAADGLPRDDDDPDRFLQVPHAEKNFLLSPPGSPPVGWVQGFEAGPNTNTHHPDLLARLAELESDPLSLDAADGSDSDSTAASPSLPQPAPTLHLVLPLAPEQDPRLDSPITIRVEDWESHHVLDAGELEEADRRNAGFRARVGADNARFLLSTGGDFGGVGKRRMPKTAMPPAGAPPQKGVRDW
ncbi:Calcipressin-domain-containing protein [Hyaloraphidium curvatum]|nr:Calcipressin-domain-containing protein [Hyaloraphidium curvatum]